MVPACTLSGVLSLYCPLLPQQLILLVLLLAGSLWIIRKMLICPLLNFGYLAWCACLHSALGGGDRRQQSLQSSCAAWWVTGQPQNPSDASSQGWETRIDLTAWLPLCVGQHPSKVRQVSHSVVFSILYCPPGCGEPFSEYYSARKCSKTETFRLELGSLSSQGSRGRCPFLQLQLQ